MTPSPLTKGQWVSVVKNALLAGVAVFVTTLQAQGAVDKKALFAAGTAAVMAMFKLVEGLYTQG